ncbi:MAG: type I-U CRISPR-associated helicase/endonuclease Cas3 [Syntrophobacteraceae bacterium]
MVNENCGGAFDFFKKSFSALVDNNPLKWQSRLFKRFIKGDIPDVLDLPTGLGKTSVIPIWLIALAAQNKTALTSLPRRLVYIVNRRTVVDQATEVVEEIRRRILNPDDPSWQEHAQVLSQLRCTLLNLSARLDDLPLAISTLRGKLADNEEWKSDPTRPAIIVGTIDMIGSKLLFCGYGDRRYHRPYHAGLIGQDALIVHDEAHLTPAFSKLLGSIAEAQICESRPVRVLELSATTIGNNGKVFSLEEEDEGDEIVQRRLDAQKRLNFPSEVGKNEFIKKMAELAKRHEVTSSKVLIYVRSPEPAQKIAYELGKKLGKPSRPRIRLLTGTMRGYERDRLVQKDPVYRAFLKHDLKVPETVYLVSTSAGEVGIDLDADHLVSDLTTLDSMIQRLGRVNRRGGEERVAVVDIVEQKAEEKEGKEKKESRFDQAAKVTLAVLRGRLQKNDEAPNASPRSLRELLNGLNDNEKITAFAPMPSMQQMTDIMLDAWSLTSIMKSIPGRPDIAPFLHGLTSDPPETYVVWRKEVKLLEEAGVDGEPLSDWFRACRIETRELLHDSTDSVKKVLRYLLKKHREKDQSRDFPVILLDERGNAERWYLSGIVEKANLAYRTVVLPVDAGGLNAEYGMLDSSSVDDQAVDVDVADTPDEDDGDGRRERWLFIKTEESDCWERLLTGETRQTPPEGLSETETVTLKEATEGAEGEVEERRLMLMVGMQCAASKSLETCKTEQKLWQHKDNIKCYIESITKALRLDPWLTNALVTAALRHDNGKARPVWQWFACNPDLTDPRAKSTKYRHGRTLGGYRHEFGSLMEAVMDIRDHPERDLILHLIAAHHGWARPHFEPTAPDNTDNTYTTDDNERAFVEVSRRFAQLQRRFGHWGLAWLEALLRCADIAASKQPATASAELCFGEAHS